MIGLLITIAFLPLVGEAVSRLIGPVPRYLAGLAACGWILFIAGVLHVWLPLAIVAVALGAIAVVLATEYRRLPAGPRTTAGWKPAVLAIYAIGVLLLVAAAIIPQHDYDGTFWTLKAKAIATDRAIDGPLFRGTGTYSPRNEYPLLMPLNSAAVMLLSGEIDDRPTRWLFPLVLIAFALEVHRRFGPWCAFIILLLPQFLTKPEGGALSAYSDIALAAFVACAFFELADGGSPARFGFWLAAMTLTKGEGLPFALILFAAGVVVFRRRVLIAAPPLAISTAALLAWRANLALTDDTDLVGLLQHLPQRLGQIDDAVLGFARYMFVWPDWGLFWIAVIVATGVLAWRREWRPLLLACGVSAAMAAVYVAIFATTEWQLDEFLRVTAPRLLMHFAGPAIFLLGRSARSR